MVGFLIGSLATLFGIILGVLFSLYIENIREFLSNVLSINLFPQEIYFLSKMPSEIDPKSILLIAICSIAVTTIVSIYPALKASRMNTAKALKYE
jgi:lipoprotein-releasing system permease protein